MSKNWFENTMRNLQLLNDSDPVQQTIELLHAI